MNWIFYLSALFIGGLLATQVALNNEVKITVGHPLAAAIVSFAVGIVSLLVFTFSSGNAGSLSNFSELTELSWWKFLGGMIGATYITSSIIIGPKIGLANMFVLIIAGQLVVGMFYDHIGFLGLPQNPVTLKKVLGALLVMAGVILMQR